jgi:hypothetical protein
MIRVDQVEEYKEVEGHLSDKIMVRNSPIKIGNVNRVKISISNEEPNVIGVSNLEDHKSLM